MALLTSKKNNKNISKHTFKIVDNDFVIEKKDCYKGNVDILKADVDLENSLSPWMQKEYKKCKKSIVYFVENYIKINTLDKGKILFRLRRYQKNLLKDLMLPQRENNILMWSRQTGKTVTTAAFILYQLCFNSFSNDTDSYRTIIAAQDENTATSYLKIIKLMIGDMPFWSQYMCLKGVGTWNKNEVEFGDGSYLFAGSATDSVRGGHYHCIVCDEGAYIDWDNFESAIFPTTSTTEHPKSIIMSTPNGTKGLGEWFYKKWKLSEKKKCDWFGYKVLWTQVPRKISKNDFKKKKISEIGIEKWKQEYELDFNSGSSIAVFDNDIIEGIKAKEPIIKNDGLKIYENYYEGHKYLATCDVAEGTGIGDYSVINVFCISNLNKVRQVAIWRKNTLEVGQLWNIIKRLTDLYRCRVIIESNGMGSTVVQMVLHNDCNAILFDNENNNEPFVFKTNKVTKPEAVSALKYCVENNNMEICDQTSLDELKDYVGKRKTEGISYGVDGSGHDDIVTTMFIMAWFLRFRKDVFFEYEWIKPDEEDDYDLLPIYFSNGDVELEHSSPFDPNDRIIVESSRMMSLPGFFG